MKETRPHSFSATAPLANGDAGVWRDILAQAVSGELVGALNYETLAVLYDDEHEKEEAIEHAAKENAHAAMFSAVGRDLGMEVIADPDALYWKRIRSAFLARAGAGDLIGCIVAQEVMLESFAVASYRRIGEVAPGKLGAIFSLIAGEEGEHVEHAVAILQTERSRAPERFDAKVHEIHTEVMTTLAEMLAREDPRGHCGLCQGSCVKGSLPGVGLSTGELRGVSLNRYLRTLDAIGVPGESTLAWIAQLPV